MGKIHSAGCSLTCFGNLQELESFGLKRAGKEKNDIKYCFLTLLSGSRQGHSIALSAFLARVKLVA